MKAWEKNIRVGRLSVRVGYHQVALWLNHMPLINWLTPWSHRLYTHRRGLFVLNRPIITYADRPEDIAAHQMSEEDIASIAGQA